MEKRRYSPPRLTEYGSITKLTLGSGGTRWLTRRMLRVAENLADAGQLDDAPHGGRRVADGEAPAVAL